MHVVNHVSNVVFITANYAPILSIQRTHKHSTKPLGMLPNGKAGLPYQITQLDQIRNPHRERESN